MDWDELENVVADGNILDALNDDSPIKFNLTPKERLPLPKGISRQTTIVPHTLGFYFFSKYMRQYLTVQDPEDEYHVAAKVKITFLCHSVVIFPLRGNHFSWIRAHHQPDFIINRMQRN